MTFSIKKVLKNFFCCFGWSGKEQKKNNIVVARGWGNKKKRENKLAVVFGGNAIGKKANI